MENPFETIQNKDNSLIRNIIVGTLHSLRDNITWDNVINSKRDKVDVPVYFSVAGSERFLSDIFLNQYKIESGRVAESMYNKIPRAHVIFESFTIEEEYLTNKFERMEHLITKEDGDVLQYSSEFQAIPIKLDMSVDVIVDSFIDLSKCIENILGCLYKNVDFYVDVDGINVPCHFSIPPDMSKERLINFGFNDKKEFMVKFDINVRASYPLINKETSIFAGNRMDTITYKINTCCKGDAPTRRGGNQTDNYRGGKSTEVIDIWPTGNNQSNFND